MVQDFFEIVAPATSEVRIRVPRSDNKDRLTISGKST